MTLSHGHAQIHISLLTLLPPSNYLFWSPCNKDVNGFILIYIKTNAPNHFFDKTPKSNSQHTTRNAHNIPHVNVKHSYFRSAIIIERNKLDSNIRNSETPSIIKSHKINFKQYFWLP